MQRDLTAYLRDILDAGTAIFRFTDGLTLEEYQDPELKRAAVERKFSIIGEALNRALELDPQIQGRISRARDIVDFRNRVMHGYFAVEDRIVWSAIKTSLPVLMQEIDDILKGQSA